MITRFVKLTFKEDKVKDFIDIWNESREYIAGFEGCNFVEMHQAKDPSNVCFTHSIWDSEAALNEYRHSDLFNRTWAKTKVLFDDKPEAWSLESYGYEGSISKR